MGRFKKLSHAVYDCKYHIVVSVPVSSVAGRESKFVETSVRMLCEWKELEIEGLCSEKITCM